MMFVLMIVLGVLITGVLVVSLTLYLFQENFIIHADKLPSSYEFQFASDFEELNIKMQDGLHQNGILFKTKNSRGLMLLMHGHSGNAEHWGSLAFEFNKLNLDVLVIDYRGFGKSPGKFSEKAALADARAWYLHMASIYPENEISLYGKGIGATFVASLASEFKPAKLILESPLYDLKFTATKYYPFFPFIKYIPSFKFDTKRYIPSIEVPIFIVHGKRNKLVHFENSNKLQKLNRDQIDLCLINDGDHHNLNKHHSYKDYIKRVVAT